MGQIPDPIFCLEGGAFDWEQLWVTTSIRGLCTVDLTVEAAKEPLHSGELGGILPCPFRVTR